VLDRLIASDPPPARLDGRALAVSVGLNALGFLLLTWSIAGSTPELEALQEPVRYVDLAEFEEPEPLPEPPEPEPPVALPEPPPAPPLEDVPLGFQELQIPPPTIGIPDPDSLALVLAAEDVRGRGVAGGLARGTAAATANGGNGGRDESMIYALPSVSRLPELLNGAELQSVLAELMPRRLRELGMGGVVVIQFVVGADGRVEEEGVVIVESSIPELAEPSREALRAMRWRPGQVGSRLVRVTVQIPITWSVR